MIFRALLISLALHLAILVPGVPGLAARKEEGQGGRKALVTTLRRQDAAQEAMSEASAMPRRIDRRVAAAGKPADVASDRVVDKLKFARFFGPTVAFANHDRRADRKADDEDVSAEFFPPGDGEREYRLNLAREARRFKRYPPGADGSDAEGAVVVSVFMSTITHRPETRLQKSSGYETLDRAALEMMEQAVKTANMPPELRGRQFRLVVPVEYRLAD